LLDKTHVFKDLWKTFMRFFVADPDCFCKYRGSFRWRDFLVRALML
jgi:hypothetical protein